MAKQDPLELYRLKRNFGITPEPAEGGESNAHALAFVVQKHWASRLHYDFRLEFEGSLKSWAVPKGPSLDPHEKRMAVQVEDHPLAYGSFEGLIPAKQYGAGKVIVWDSGFWTPLEDPAQGFRDGKLKFELHGHKLKGRWTLVRMRGKDEKQPPWLLIKEHDAHERAAADYSITEAEPDSVSQRKPIAAPSPAQAARVQLQRPASAGKTRAANALPAGAVKAALPATLEPQLATLVESPPPDGDWLYELKFDGYRLMARLTGGEVSYFTRNGHDWTSKMPALAAALKALGLDGCWLDGEIVVPDPQGIPDFQLLQGAFEARGRHLAANAASTSAAAPIIYYVFDMPFYNGHDLRAVPLVERRALLQRILQGVLPGGARPTKPLPDNIRFSETFDAPAKDLVQSACKLGLEGLIGKRADSAYQSGRSTDWIKLKCGQRQEFVICGYTDPKGSRSGLGALLLGVHDNAGGMVYAGNVGTGFNNKMLADLTAKLVKTGTPSSPFASQVALTGKPHWVKPQLLAEVSFAEWTSSGRIRHGVFRGLREDKKPSSITRDKAVATSKIAVNNAAKSTTRLTTKTAGKAAAKTASQKTVSSAPPVISLPKSLRVTHGDRVVDKSSGLTKLNIIQHYAAVAALMLPHLKGRPVSLVRAPAGVGGELFFQKHLKVDELPGVNLLDPALDPDHASLLEISTVRGLMSAAQMNALEFHTWNATATAIGKPDRLIFDLDPGDGVSWPQIQEAAVLVRTLVEELGLLPFLKTSGGKGLHVVIPLKRLLDWDTVKGFSQAVVQHLARTIPQRFVAKSGPKNRIGKIFVDYLRNGFGATTVSAWSARARPGMGVSVPVAWDELADLASGAHWTVQNIGNRLAVGNTPWAAYAASARSLKSSMQMLDFKPPKVTDS